MAALRPGKTTVVPSSDAFDAIMGRLDYAMFVVTARRGEERSGCLVGFAGQVSIDPARFLVCISRQNRTMVLASDAAHLAVHVVPDDALQLAELFGHETGDDVDKFAECEWSDGPFGLPLLTACRDWFAGPVLDRFDFGDHVGHVVAPEAISENGGGRPLLFSAAKRIDPGHPA